VDQKQKEVKFDPKIAQNNEMTYSKFDNPNETLAAFKMDIDHEPSMNDQTLQTLNDYKNLVDSEPPAEVEEEEPEIPNPFKRASFKMEEKPEKPMMEHTILPEVVP
jgi:hypothetical protein